MERGVDKDLIAAWRWMAGFTIFPVTVIPGFHAVILLISSFCVFLDCWSLEGAMTNLSLGLPAAAGVAALWISTLLPLSLIVRTRSGFVLVTTGLLMGIVLECLLLRAELGGDLSRLSKVGLFQACVFGCPWAIAVVNLFLLIRTRELSLRPPIRIIAEEIKAPVRRRGVPPYHLQSAPVLRPVILKPYQAPVSTWSYFDETMFD
jgi:hypothetical protein